MTQSAGLLKHITAENPDPLQEAHDTLDGRYDRGLVGHCLKKGHDVSPACQLKEL